MKAPKAEEAKKVAAVEEAPPAQEKAEAAAETNDFSSALGRFMTALWETYTDVASQPGKTQERGWEYRKGIEGMSMGSLHYEMLTTSEDTEDFRRLQDEYQKGWGVPFVNFSLRSISGGVRDASKSLGLDGVFQTAVNFLETLGVDGEVFDGIPVRNRWIDYVADSMSTMSSEDTDSGRRKINTMMQNMVMGRMERIAGAPMPVFLERYGQDEGLYKITIFPRSIAVVADPVIAKHIFTSSQANYTKGILSEVLEPIMGRGLIPADPVTWRSRRRAIAPGFHAKWIQGSTEQMVECAERLCDEMERGLQGTKEGSACTVNMEEKFTSVSLDIIGKAVFGYDFRSVARESPIVGAVYSVLREAERRAQSVIPYWDLPGASTVFPDQKSHEENLTLLNAVLDELIRTAMEEPESDEEHVSLLRFLVMTRNEDVTTRQLRDDLMTLLIAGHETTAAVLTWTLYELVKPEHSELLEEVIEEVDTVVGGRQPSYDDLRNLPKLTNCLLEALRLYPEPPILIRRCVDGDEVPVGPTCKSVKGKTFNFLPGQDIFISTWSLQRAKSLWGEDATEFNPYRWEKPIEGQGRWQGYNPAKAKNYPNEVATDFAFVPFGAGARKCIGDNFALLEAQAVMVSMLTRFSFEAVPGAGEVGMATGATIHTVGGLKMNIKRRTHTAHQPQRLPSSLPALPVMEAKSSLSVAQRLEPEALVVPTPQELRRLFNEQAAAMVKYQEPENMGLIEEAYEKCREVTREHSKTFFLGSQLLSPEEQRVVWAIYNWCRDTDELVDGPDAASTTMEDLERWEEQLARTFSLGDSLKSSEWQDLALADSVRNFSLIERPFQDMIGGMAMDLVKYRYATFQELEVYCYRVAGTVGVMTLPVLGFDGLQNFTEELQDQTIGAAQSLGVAFQLTNILRDIGEDARRGRIYVPQEDLRRFNIGEDEVLEAAHAQGKLFHEQRWRDFMEFQFDRCDRFYAEAVSGIIGLSEVNRLGVMAALYVYGAILDRIRENNYDNFSRRAYVTFGQKMLLIFQAWNKCQELEALAQENIRTGKIFSRPVVSP